MTATYDIVSIDTPADWQALKPHAIAEGFKPLADDEYADLIGGMRETGYHKDKPIALFAGLILDGRHRHKGAVEVGVVPTFVEFVGTEEDAQKYADQSNENRRPFPLDERAQKRKDRIARVAAARKDGQSIRTIAASEGVTTTQIQRDLTAAVSGVTSPVTPDQNGHAKSELSGDTPPVSTDQTSAPAPPGNGHQANGKPPVTVKGADGKTYQADPKPLCRKCRRLKPVEGCPQCAAKQAEAAARKKRAKKVVLCEKCQAAEKPTPGCNDCKKARAAAKKPRKKVKTTEPLKDAFGNDIPGPLRDVWADVWIQETFDFLAVTADGLRSRRLLTAMNKRKQHYPFFDAKDFCDGVGFVDNYLDQLVQHLKDNRPAGVCPSCKGERCADCRMSGLVPRSVYEKLAGVKK